MLSPRRSVGILRAIDDAFPTVFCCLFFQLVLRQSALRMSKSSTRDALHKRQNAVDKRVLMKMFAKKMDGGVEQNVQQDRALASRMQAS